MITINVTEKIVALVVLLVLIIALAWFFNQPETPPNGSGNGQIKENNGSTEDIPVKNDSTPKTPTGTKPTVLYSAYDEPTSADQGQKVVFKDSTVEVVEAGESPLLRISFGDYPTDYPLQEGTFKLDFVEVDITEASEEGVSFTVSERSRESDIGTVVAGFVDPVKIKNTEVAFIVTEVGTGKRVVLIREGDEYHVEDLVIGGNFTAGGLVFSFFAEVEDMSFPEEFGYMFNIYKEEI